jgi:hypothetical protein
MNLKKKKRNRNKKFDISRQLVKWIVMCLSQLVMCISLPIYIYIYIYKESLNELF